MRSFRLRRSAWSQEAPEGVLPSDTGNHGKVLPSGRPHQAPGPRGQQPSDALFAQAGQLAADASSPADDLRGSAEYKLTLIRELIQRALRRSVERAQGRS